jgi:hypothetical protein
VSGGVDLSYRDSWYVRMLRLRHLRPGGLMTFLLFEGTMAVAALLALAELASWWAVAVLPIAVAAMVKVNDMATGAYRGVERTPVERHDGFGPFLPPEYSVPDFGGPAAVVHTRSSRVYKSSARAAAEAAMETALVDAGNETPAR